MNFLALIPAIGKIIEKVIPDPNQALELKTRLAEAAMNTKSELYRAQGSIITAEAKGESWMQRNWRPITMLTFVFIIANNYIFAPYAQFLTDLFGGTVVIPKLEIPDGMWGLLQIGIGGYVASRGVEKTVQKVQQGGTPIIGSRQSKDAVTRDDLRNDREELLRELKQAGGPGER